MPLPFRRDLRRDDLEQLREQIAHLREDVDQFEAELRALGGDDSTSADAYSTVKNLRATMVRHEIEGKRAELAELEQREAELAKALKLPPGQPPQKLPAPLARAATAPAPVEAPPVAEPESVPRPSNGAAHAPERTAEVARPAAAPKPEQAPRNVGAALWQVAKVAFALVLIAITAAVGYVLSGLSDLLPIR